MESSSNVVTVNNQSSSTRDIRLNSDLSALSIRATEYLQRWKEVNNSYIKKKNKKDRI